MQSEQLNPKALADKRPFREGDRIHIGGGVYWKLSAKLAFFLNRSRSRRLHRKARKDSPHEPR